MVERSFQFNGDLGWRPQVPPHLVYSTWTEKRKKQKKNNKTVWETLTTSVTATRRRLSSGWLVMDIFFFYSRFLFHQGMSCSCSWFPPPPFFPRRLCKLGWSCSKPFKYGESASVQGADQSITEEKTSGVVVSLVQRFLRLTFHRVEGGGFAFPVGYEWKELRRGLATPVKLQPFSTISIGHQTSKIESPLMVDVWSLLVADWTHPRWKRSTL